MIEVLATPLLEGGNTRLDVQVAGLFDGATEVRNSRAVLEVLARQGSAGPVVPLALVDDAHIFLHNWASRCEVSTSFRTDVKYTPSTGAEARRGLNVKPFRTMRLEWLEGNDLSLSDLERLEVFFRRMTDQRFQIPLYPDQQELLNAHASAVDTLVLDTTQARLFPGARIGIVLLDACYQPTGFSFHTISSMTNASLTLSAALGVDVPAGSLVFPVLDCEVALEVQTDYNTSRVSRLSVTVAEAPGGSQLPALKSDNPTNAPLGHDGRPVWFEEPDWSAGVTKGRLRHGASNGGGRADFVSTESDRSRQKHSYTIAGKRTQMWDALEFFETRRGRLRSFWHIDQDQYMETLDLDTSGNFADIRVIGDLTDMQEEFDAIGIVMSDGTVYVREVSNIQDITTVFRITMTPIIGTGLSAGNVHRLARARLTRFESDEFTERWTHTGYSTTDLSFIETLNEADYTI